MEGNILDVSAEWVKSGSIRESAGKRGGEGRRR